MSMHRQIEKKGRLKEMKRPSYLQRNRDPKISIKISIALVISILFVFPVVWMLFVSIKPEGFQTTNPISWFLPPYTIVNYINLLLDSLILRWMLNSLIVGVITTLLTLILTSLAAYAISQMKFHFKNSMFIFLLLGLMIPGEATIVPLYEVAKSLNLLDSYTGLILPMAASPLGIIILKSFFDGVPREVIESAIMDGCSHFKIYYKIVLPLSKPALGAIGIFTFIGSWNNFLWPFISILSEKLFTLPVGIPVFNSAYTDTYVLPMTANAIASIPLIIAFLFFEKQIVKGLNFTGIKG